MTGWKSYLLWEGLPFLMVLGMFAFISCVNRSYESKLLAPGPDSSSVVITNMGRIFLAFALGQTFLASVILYIVRITRPKTGAEWYMFISLTITAVFLIFPAMFIVVLGPASIQIYEALDQAPK